MNRSASFALAALGFGVVTASAAQASAQEAAEPTNASATHGPADAPPPAHTGLQLGLRTGVAVPFGEVESGARMSDSFTPQVPILADLGIKVAPDLFLGAYFGVSFGGVGKTVEQGCDAVGVDCTAFGVRFGIQAQYHFNPDGTWNPWIGYGIGLELLRASGAKNDDRFHAGLFGVEYAHFMAGADYRVNEVVGIGPFADFALGQYGGVSIESTRNGVSQKNNGDLANPSLHEWLTLGLKVTFFP